LNIGKSSAIIPRPSIVEVPRMKTHSSASPDSPEIIDQLCVCAVHDSHYIVRYVRQPHGKYRPTTTLKLGVGRETGHPKSGETQKLPIEKIEGSCPPCPWCGCHGSTRYHCRCGGVVCGGRVEGTLFKCRVSCGAQWYSGVPANEINGLAAGSELKDQRTAGRTTAKPSTTTSQALPDPGRLLLGPASNVPARRATGDINRSGGRP
jgi:hypothetical protein